ncbi:related to CMC1-mitochondrial intermembrane space copper-binding protein [Sporisorium reilianum f. sp. reilianum]|uniref:COX assembly mitochondrial protein n=1 Tax=Sporisorium reilianum f. sp. reilianum TaxID=72559 RepID=A0A2N8UK68_9BASI|nr:related to CMC1-mitochondrial intermembrane space copper-binding protein [Sporisorium reilianum f. sp. reilianum]
MSAPASQQQRILSNREADTLMKQQKAKALQECKAQMEAFVECSKTRTISMLWSCREQKQALSECLRVYTSEEAMEREKQLFLQQARSGDESKAV